MLRILEMTRHNDDELLAAARQEAAALPADPADDAPIAVRIPGYEISQALGRGGQATVYEAVQTATGRRVALKVLQADATAPSRWARFQREVRLLARVQHPNLVTVYDSGEADGSYYYAMELVEGRALDAYVHNGGLNQRAILSLFATVCAAVHAAHQRGVIHRDLKPANILVDTAGQPRVLDFGLAKPAVAVDTESPTATAMTADGQFLGTIKWASPEQVGGGVDDVDVRSDVYSLGVILYKLLTTAPPYETAGPLHDAVDNIVNARPQRPSTLDRSIDHDVEAIVLRCLAKEPERRYGTVGELAADIRRYLAGEPIEAKRDSRLYVLRKTIARHRVLASAASLALLLGVGFGIVMTVLYQEARTAQEAAEREAVRLRAELQEVRDSLVSPANWTSAINSARVLAAMPPDEAWTVLQSAWKEMTEDHPKQQLLKTARFAWVDYLPRVLHLGMTDPSHEVQNWAISYLREVAFIDFANDFSAYEAWHAKHGDKPLAVVLEANCRRYVDELRALDVAARGRKLESTPPYHTFRDRPRIAELARKLGMIDLLMECLTDPDAPTISVRAASRALRHMPLGEEFLRTRILPLTEDERYEVSYHALMLLGEKRATFAIDTLLEQMRHALGDPRAESRLSTLANALAKIGDPRVIPDLIAIIAADNSHDTIYGVGYHGLGAMTRVQYDESHDGAWWQQWWKKNRLRFPEEVARREIPTLTVDASSEKPAPRPTTAPARPPIAAEPPAETLLAGGNERMAYFLIGPAAEAEPPEDGFRLLLVLPGGDGSADFHPFVRRIAEHALDDHCLVAQLVAPRWTPEQFNRVVWPTRGLKIEAAEFLTEDFIRAVVADVKARHKVDDRLVFALGWSSGGPPVYAAGVDPKSPVRGLLVAMSVFKPALLGDLAGVEGKAVYVLHSPQDFIPMRMAESARDLLAKAGATTTLATYDGGHGWHGDVYGNIRRGVRWLEHESAEREAAIEEETR
jgi:predicted esterase